MHDVIYFLLQLEERQISSQVKGLSLPDLTPLKPLQMARFTQVPAQSMHF